MTIIHGIFKKDLIDLVVFVSTNKTPLSERNMRKILTQTLPLLIEIVSISELIKSLIKIIGRSSTYFDPAIFKYCLTSQWFAYDMIKEGT